MVAAKLTLKPLSKLEVLLEAAPEAARIACPLNSNNLPLHMILSRRKPYKELVAVMMMLYAAYKEAANISNDDGILPVHYAAQNAPFEVMKMIAEDNLSNLSVIVPMYGSVAHLASQDCNDIYNPSRRSFSSHWTVRAELRFIILSMRMRMTLITLCGSCFLRYRLLRMRCGFCSVIGPAWPLLETPTI